MLKLNESKFLIAYVLLLVVNLSLAILSEDLMEKSCTNSEQCQYYETEDVNSTCVGGACHCYNNATHSITTCRPNILRTNNIIGGNCPCNLPHAECKPSDNLCYCEANYISTKDKRRCVPTKIILGEPCEMDSQCRTYAVFSHCANDTKICTCNENFIQEDFMCLSRSRFSPECQNDRQCMLSGPNQFCLPEIGECVCKPGFISSNKSKHCLDRRRFNETCLESLQCHIPMGPGGSCENGKCRCKEEYALVTDTMKCELLPQIGQYCTENKHCHLKNQTKDEQLMECDRGECVCRFGAKNESPCDTSIATRVIKSQFCLWFMLAVAILSLKQI
ncbi:cell death abnormality protein 1 [Anastrepha obliqua]|uniref:cell death abnormality protein 1 n=1 Tax=Anastrepha obliqua TaxID=95512 RepID=UPI002409FB59|nr:cell death abnormality protein 1 [Anastrepha obliqua]